MFHEQPCYEISVFPLFRVVLVVDVVHGQRVPIVLRGLFHLLTWVRRDDVLLWGKGGVPLVYMFT